MKNIGSISVTDSQYELLLKDLELIIEANKRVNLTRIDSFDQGMLLHLEDSLVALPEVTKAPDGLYADLGTGGGFPGIPLAIITGKETLLVDSVQKKVQCLKEVIMNLGISEYVSTYAGRIEDLTNTHRNTFSLITARALSSLPSLLELVSPLLQNKGEFIAYKSHLTEQEERTLLQAEEVFGLKLISRRELYLSDNQTFRTILVFKKFKEAKIKLPRRVGLAQKNPLT